MSPPERQLAASREVRELTLLFEISRLLDRSLDLRNVVGPVLQAMADHMGMLRGTLTLLNRQTGEMIVEVAHGLSAAQRKRGHYRPGEGVTARVIETGKPAVVPRISDEPLFLDRTRSRGPVNKKDISYISVPIILGNEVVGALSADRLFAEGVSFEEDVRLLSIIASMIGQAVRLRRDAQQERRLLMEENLRLQEELKDRFHPSNIIGNSRAMQDVYSLIAQVSGSNTTVLIRGESGTGKELVAHAIHYGSPRASMPFIKVNCAALPETVLESELFGHEKGSFTGAHKLRKGRFELAHGGTIFLDEIGDLSPATQIRLLRVLQEKEFERIGGVETIKADVRVITATNRNIEELVDEGGFRQDLYYRLNVFPIHIPPLRARRADILLLADHFVSEYGKANHKQVRRISTRAIDMLLNHHWPGNVRELENCIERAVLLTNDGVIHCRNLPPTVQTAETGHATPNGNLQSALDALEREILVEALEGTRGNRAGAARTLGITERVMGLRVEKHGIDTRQFRNR